MDPCWPRYYSLFTLGMLVMFECTVVGQRLRNLRELRSLTVPKQALLVYRQGRWDQLPGDALLPGDVISIGRPSGGTPYPAACIPVHTGCACFPGEPALNGLSQGCRNPVMFTLPVAQILHVGFPESQAM